MKNERIRKLILVRKSGISKKPLRREMMDYSSASCRCDDNNGIFIVFRMEE